MGKRNDKTGSDAKMTSDSEPHTVTCQDVPKLGDLVSVAGASRIAKILSGPNKRNEYLIELGNLHLWTHRDKLGAPNQTKLAKSEKKSIKIRKHQSKLRDSLLHCSAKSSKSAKPVRLDLHGMTRSGAITALEQAIDRAILNGTEQIECIHGIGTGAVKSAVLQYLTTSKHVKSHRPAQSPNGSTNPGTTIIYL